MINKVKSNSLVSIPTKEEIEITERNRAIVSELYERVNSGDLAGISSFRDRDYRMVQAPGHPVGGTWIGDGASAAGGRIFATLGIKSLTVHEIVADGPNRVIGLINLHGVEANGNPWTMPVAECWLVENGVITEVRPFYWDLVEVCRIAGDRIL